MKITHGRRDTDTERKLRLFVEVGNASGYCEAEITVDRITGKLGLDVGSGRAHVLIHQIDASVTAALRDMLNEHGAAFLPGTTTGRVPRVAPPMKNARPRKPRGRRPV